MLLSAGLAVTLLGAAGEVRDVGLGLLNYREGKPAEAVENWRHAAMLGDARGALYIGVLYDTGHGVAPDARQALAWYRRAADLGSAAGAFNVAVFYDSGLGVAQDQQAAIEWYARAATLGSGRAAYNLALMYESGAGVQPDRGRAIALYKQAASRGIPAAREHLASLGRSFTGRSQPDDAATRDFQQAEQILLSRGPVQAARMTDLLRSSADRHNALGEYDLGYCYAHGLGVPLDRPQALKWYRRALQDATDDALRAIAQAGVASLAGVDDVAPGTLSATAVSSGSNGASHSAARGK